MHSVLRLATGVWVRKVVSMLSAALRAAPVVHSVTIPKRLPFDRYLSRRVFALLTRAFRAQGDRLVKEEIAARLGIQFRDKKLHRALVECEAKGLLGSAYVLCRDGVTRKRYWRVAAGYGGYVSVVEIPEIAATGVAHKLFLAMQLHEGWPSFTEWATLLRVSYDAVKDAVALLKEMGAIVEYPGHRQRAWVINPALVALGSNPAYRVFDEDKLPRGKRPKPQLAIVKKAEPSSPPAATSVPASALDSVPVVVPGSDSGSVSVAGVASDSVEASGESAVKPGDLLSRALATATRPPTPPAPDTMRHAAHVAYEEHRLNPTPIDSKPIEQVVWIILGRMAALSSHLAEKMLKIDANTVAALHAVLMWLKDIEPREDDGFRSHYIKKWVGGKPYEFAYNAVSSLFSGAFTGFTYDPRVLFKPGANQNFDRFCIDTLRRLQAGEHLIKVGRNLKLLAASLQGVDARLDAVFKELGVQAPVAKVVTQQEAAQAAAVAREVRLREVQEEHFKFCKGVGILGEWILDCQRWGIDPNLFEKVV